MAPRKNFKFTYPFQPPWEDLKMTIVTPNGVKCHIFDTCVETDPDKIAQIERNIANIIIRHEERMFLQEQDRLERARQESGAL